ncbi:DMT family transporter [Pseudofulvibacter geojedonensis]|uniref:DMT family transporter n=1 Tax=Pseudofulvibacter geojedonensis TaxID=1123758 RepID=A0ABW3I1M1_9FLAO
MNNHNLKWIFLIILSVIWGSSFVLMKIAIDNGLSALQLGALRIVICSLFLFVIGFNQIKKIRKKHVKWVALSAFLGTFFPVFLFSYAHTQIDSSIASILNSLTPLNTIIFGYLAFSSKFTKNQLLGVLTGLTGTVILIILSKGLNPNQNYLYSLLVLAASICYAFNVHIIKKHLQDLNPISIAVGNFIVIFIPSAIMLYFTKFFDLDFSNNYKIKNAIISVLALAVFGTGIAKIMFNKLVQIATPIFASSVTYTIPIVAVILGTLYGEKLNMLQLIAAGIILLGVYLANKKAKKSPK